MSEPRVSVVMPTYNYGRFLNKAIEGILNQTFDDFELIIIDDGSTDDTPEVIEQYGDDRIVVIRREENSGSNSWVRNEGMAIASGEFIVATDADDVSVQDRIEKQVAFLDRYSKVDILGGGLLPVDTNGRPIGAPVYKPVYTKNPEKYRLQLLQGETVYVHSALMFRRAILDRLGGYHFYTAGGDYEFMLRATRYFTFCNLQKVLVHSRQHQSSTTQTFGKRMKRHYRAIFMAQEQVWVSRQLERL